MAAELRIHTKAPLPLLHGGRGILFLCLGTGNVLLDLYASFQGCTIFDDNAGRIDVAHHNSRFLQLNATLKDLQSLQTVAAFAFPDGAFAGADGTRRGFMGGRGC